MEYVSTRGLAPRARFSRCADGGPRPRRRALRARRRGRSSRPTTIAGFAGRPYAEVAFEVIRAVRRRRHRRPRPPRDVRGRPTRPSATRPSRRSARSAPDQYVLELFHGPTLAFKDVAMQLLARLMDHVLAERGERMTIVGATSGDTGGGRDRGLPRPRQRRRLHPLSRGPRLAVPAAADDDHRRRPMSSRSRSRAPSTTARRS